MMIPKYKFYDLFHKSSSLQTKLVSEKNFTYRIVFSILNQVLRNKNNLDILDFGCGSGTLSLYFASKGNNVVGIDISPKVIRTAKASASRLDLRKELNFFTLNEGKRKIKGQRFDLILCIEVLEHIKNDEVLLRFFSSHLKKSGYLILSTPSKNAPLYKIGLTKNFDKRVGHLRRYNLKSLEKVFLRANLKVKDSKKTEGIIRNSLFVIPFLGRFIKFLKGPLSDLFTFLDQLTIPLLGESDIFVVAQKK
ncbi:hypothetical protein A3D01_05625 [Candidatus Woesebacteria bacterium RIFCSPHIGHO2_02_FULL_39_13]|uniref:Methyltransferase domain-containing protein n=1 Tax=Candidatus Woesebacteria bacterium RIFCSPHIGHO2_02_FULL_39_13 TaxID=1802505 RepID=A0A1F7Z2K8_9BACT|nr:MAG: hypothetical protein A3D01_05625 [Candidatus Woesebacteria bacterium RIFCSPHIGHO2_02_FULL_39_13]OGM74577.1 MAG: hypothetical protein A3H19_00010 [Candidatus Woesebacteria bacterium RIFCSPLOWO2_12_FULL_39_9]